jgi:hypothetical protein
MAEQTLSGKDQVQQGAMSFAHYFPKPGKKPTITDYYEELLEKVAKLDSDKLKQMNERMLSLINSKSQEETQAA